MRLPGPITLLFAAAPARHSRLPRWVAHLGAPGLFLISFIDSSVVPLPIPGTTDLLLLFLVAHRGNALLLVASAITGSILGGYITWHLGKRSGEAALQRYVPRHHLDRITGWVKHHPILSVSLPAVLPPPIPLSPFLLASGALGVGRNRFLVVFGAARFTRYSLIAWLAEIYGRRVIRMWSTGLEKWSTPLLFIFLGIMALSIAYAVWKMRRTSGRPVEAESV